MHIRRMHWPPSGDLSNDASLLKHVWFAMTLNMKEVVNEFLNIIIPLSFGGNFTIM
jgi:hypothetical protein